MKARIEKYIPVALKIIRQGIGKNNQVAEEYDGYAASFGPAVIASGLLPAISFYTDIHKSTEEGKPRRYEILKVVSGILSEREQLHINDEKNGLLEFLISKTDKERDVLRPIIMDAIIAIKLSLRNFKQVKSS